MKKRSLTTHTDPTRKPEVTLDTTESALSFIWLRSKTSQPLKGLPWTFLQSTEDTILQEIDRDLVAESTKGVLLRGRHSYRAFSQKRHNSRKLKHRSRPCSLILPKRADPQTDLSNPVDEVSWSPIPALPRKTAFPNCPLLLVSLHSGYLKPLLIFIISLPF